MPETEEELQFLETLAAKKQSASYALTNIRNKSQELLGSISTFNDENQDRLWRVYAESIRSLVNAGGNEVQANNLQIATSLNPIRWGDPDYGSYYFQIDAADTMPEIGPSYAKTAQTFSDSYYTFLTSINAQPIDEESKKKADDALDKLNQERNDLTSFRIELGKQWVKYDKEQEGLPAELKLTFEQWMEEVEGKKQLDDAKDLVDVSERRYLFWLTKAYSPDEPFLKASARYRDFSSKRLTIKIPRNADNPNAGQRIIEDVYPFVNSPDFPKWLKEAPTRSPNLNIKYSETSRTYDYSRTRVSGGALVSFGFFGVIGAGRRTTTSINIAAQSFEFELSAVAEVFNISTEDWYESTLFSLYRDGPFKEGGPIDRAYKSDRLFGPNGFLTFRPARAVLAYKPKVTLKFDRQDYSYFKEETRGWAAVAIGPFAIGGGSFSSVRIRTESNDSDGSISLFAEDDFPYLLAFDYEDLDPR
ncbi:MAG: hypothetical protein F6K19_12865 [Cyanothece sp. SIO1E1]|nr:hypothetical protein [Cyanothece sp. SIO1E1]